MVMFDFFAPLAASRPTVAPAFWPADNSRYFICVGTFEGYGRGEALMKGSHR